MNENFEYWQEPDTAQAAEAELKKIRQTIRRRNVLIILICLLLVGAIALGTVKILIPALEARYPNPGKPTICKTIPDLALTLTAYSELFSPTQMIEYVYSTRTDFATYAVTLRNRGFADPYNTQGSQYFTTTMEKGKLTFAPQFWQHCSVNIFERACYPTYDMGEEFDKRTRENLQRLPDYILVEAAVSFTEDLSMEQIAQLQESLEDGFLEWIGIRSCPPDRQQYPLCGIKPYVGGILLSDANEIYPYFDIKSEEYPESFDDHFKTLLQFTLDRYNDGTALEILPQRSEDYYESILAYVEENGVYSYGAYIIAPAAELLELMDNGTASQIWPQNAWIDF